MKIKDKINLVSTVIFIGFALSVFFHYILGAYLKMGYPFNTFLFNPSNRFMDFFNVYKLTDSLNPYVQTNHLSIYFPFANIFFYFFALIPLSVSFPIFSLIFVLYFVYYNYKNLTAETADVGKLNIIKNLFVFSILSYPFLFLIDRGNLEAYVFILLSLFVYFYAEKSYLKSILCLSFATSMKLYPIVFLALFIPGKKFREIFYTLFLVLFQSVTSLLFFKGGFLNNINYFLQHLSIYNKDYVIGDLGLSYGSSLLGVLKVIIFKTHSQLAIQNLGGILNVIVFKIQSSQLTEVITKALQTYNIVAIVSVILILAYLIFIEKVFWKKITLLTLSTIIFMPVSGDYKLIHIFIPLWLFINNKKDLSKKSGIFYAIFFALLLIPKDYLFFLVDQRWPHFFSTSILLNPLIMSIIIFAIVAEGVKKKFTIYAPRT